MIRPILLATAMLFTGHAMAVDATKAVFPGNEAVSTSPSGERMVQYMKPAKPNWPSPLYLSSPSASATKVGTPIFDMPMTTLYMIEGAHELLECSELVIDSSVCRSSTLGTKKSTRMWLVLLKGQWVLCQKAGTKAQAFHGDYVCSSDLPKNAVLLNLVVKE